jgi:hypothetical protein
VERWAPGGGIGIGAWDGAGCDRGGIGKGMAEYDGVVILWRRVTFGDDGGGGKREVAGRRFLIYVAAPEGLKITF